MRVRDVEIALVLAREMKDAAARDVDASLRLEQLKEVFGADELDAGERARIQTALQMAGLEPSPSLLEADPADPIRFGVTLDAKPAPAPVAQAPAEQRQEFPTVGEFFRRFRRKRRGADDRVTTATELPPEPEPEPEPEAELEEPEPEEPELEESEVDEPLNGHVDVETNGHHAELLDEVALPPHDTATPADFGASAETIDFDDPRVEEELLDDEPEPEPEPEPAPPQPPPVEEIAALLAPLVAIPVLITSFVGWTFGLPFVALSLIAAGFLAGRRAGFLSTLRGSAAARTMLKTTLLVTAASVAVAIVLANVGGSDKPKQPAAKRTAPPAPAPAPKQQQPAPKHHTRKARPAKPKARTHTAPQAPAPDPGTQGLYKAPPSTGSGAQTQTQTTPTPQTQQP